MHSSALSDREVGLLKNTFLDLTQTTEFLKTPLIVDRAEGLYVWGRDGNRYFDAIGGIFVAVLGHRHPRVLDAMRAQMEKITFAPPLHSISSVTLEFIEKLAAVTPGNLNFIKPYSGGSESVESALKFARQYYRQTGRPGKYKFISRYLGYHGSTFGAMSASGTGARKTRFEPMLTGFCKVFPPNHYRDQFSSWDKCNRFCAHMFEDVIVHEDPATVAGVIVEPIGNTGGIITPTAEYYRILREICDRYDVMLIFDEIITGYARTGAMFAAQAYDVVPDIICGGKGLGSGHVPLGAMMAREDVGAAFLGDVADGLEFAHGHTFAGNPLACAAGIAVLAELTENDMAAKARRLGDSLVARLGGLKKYGVIREIRGKGVLRGVEFTRDPATNEPFPELGRALKVTALENGIILRVDPNWFAMSPPLIAEESDLDEMCDRIEKSLCAALRRVGR